MGAFADLELVPLLLWLGAFVLASFAQLLAKAVAAGVSYLPFVGGVLDSAIEDAIIKPLTGVIDDAEAGIAKGLSALENALGTLGGLALLGVAGAVAGFGYLWNKGIPDLIGAASGLLHTAISNVSAVANGAERDAANALTQLAGIISWSAKDIKNLMAKPIEDAVSAGVATAESYADSAVSKLKVAEDAAVATAVQLATTAEHDATQAYTDATTYVDSLVKPIGADLTDFEQYVKGLGLQGVIAASAATAAVLTTVLAETGLKDEACRSKVSGICSTDPLAWAGLLAGIAAIGVSFDLAAIVALLNELIDPVEALVKKAA